MKLLDDVIASIAGNTKTRVSDPLIGTFVCSWFVCNWNHLALLFWSEGKVSDRVDVFYRYVSDTPLFSWNEIFTIPMCFSFFYVFIFPWVSFFMNFIKSWADGKLHRQAVNMDLSKLEQQEKLNKERLKINPDKQFLEQLVQQDLDKRGFILEHLRLRTSRLEAKANEAKSKESEQISKSQEAKNKESLSNLELIKKNQQNELEKMRFESDSAKARAAHASNRLPSAYYLLHILDESLINDGIYVSLRTLGRVISSLFGYENFETLINDRGFNNETLANVKYVYYDDGLAKRLEQVVLDENSSNEDFSTDVLFDHFEMLFYSTPFELITGNNLAERCKETFENDPNDVFDGDGVSGAIAESDTIFDYVEDISLEQYNFDNGFSAELSAHASGDHYREEGVPGRSMSLSIIMQCNVVVGKFGLGSIVQGDVKGSLDEYE